MRIVQRLLASLVGLLIVLGLFLALLVEDPESQAQPPIRVEGGLLSPSDVMQDISTAARTQGPEGLREAIREHRVTINVSLINASARARTGWFPALERAMAWLALALGLGLVGWPLVRRNLETFPFFALFGGMSALTLTFLSSFLIDVQNTQLTVASAGASSVAIADATLQYAISSDDAHITALNERFAQLTELSQDDPLEAFALLGRLWQSRQTLREAPLTETSLAVFNELVWLGDLYGPILALMTLVLLIRVVGPILRDFARYPAEAEQAQAPPALAPFLKEELKLIGRELKLTFLMVLLIFVVLAVCVVLVRLVTMPVVFSALRALLAAEATVFEGGTLPEVGLFATLLSLGLTLLLLSLVLLVPAGVLLSHLYTMLRQRAQSGQRLRDMAPQRKALRGLIVPVMGGGLLAFALGLSVVWLLSPLSWVYVPMATAPLVLVALVVMRVPTALLKHGRLRVQ